ncbi:zinc ribbon domain-containing protein, partial [Acidobacteria bacterium AH-259-D05]|nr:zinc ribbon domain-containing protein [Acidobacteria bacterium AH-259-D05]
MKICPSCDRTFGDDKKFCNYCGDVLSPAGKDQNIDLPTEEASELSKTSQEIHCPSCGKALPNSEAKFCRFCGAVLKPSEANIKPMSPVADAGATLFGSTEYLSSKASVFSKRSVWLISSLALAVALGGVVLFVSQTSKSAIPTTTQIQGVPAEKEGTNQAIPSPKTQRVETAQGDSRRDSNVPESIRVEAQSSERNT